MKNSNKAVVNMFCSIRRQIEKASKNKSFDPVLSNAYSTQELKTFIRGHKLAKMWRKSDKKQSKQRVTRSATRSQVHMTAVGKKIAKMLKPVYQTQPLSNGYKIPLKPVPADSMYHLYRNLKIYK